MSEQNKKDKNCGTNCNEKSAAKNETSYGKNESVKKAGSTSQKDWSHTEEANKHNKLGKSAVSKNEERD